MQDAQDLQGQWTEVIVGERLRAFRENKALSQSDMEEALGHFSLLHISGGEWAHDPDPGNAREICPCAASGPCSILLYEEEGPYQPPVLPKSRRSTSEKLSKRDLGLLERFIGLLNQLRDRDKQLLLGLGRRMVKRATCRSPFGEKLGTKYKVGTQRTGPSRGMSPSRKGRR
jgi:hypothetical protein